MLHNTSPPTLVLRACLPVMTPREVLCIVPLVVFSVLLGVLPNLLLGWMEPTVTGLVNTLARVSGW